MVSIIRDLCFKTFEQYFYVNKKNGIKYMQATYLYVDIFI